MAEILAILPSPTQLRALAGHTLRHGHSLYAAKDVARARDLLSSHKPDVVVAPIDLECGQVISLLCWAKNDSELSNTKFLLFAETERSETMSETQPLRHAARVLGVDRFVSFPHFQADELWWQIAVIIPDA